MHFFANHLRPGQQTTHSLRVHQYKLPSKRKRNEDDVDQDDNEADSGVSSRDHVEVPPTPFPHALAHVSKPNFNHAKVQRELASLDAPLFAVNATSKNQLVGGKSEAPALRQTHLGVLTAIMHQCLFERDYGRAGRAWGLILRSQIAGHSIDPRNHGRWGIGAEVLLRRDVQNASQSSEGIPHELNIYSEEGFELAREYYQRLIVQHPNRKTAPHAVDDRLFYPAMFSVWINEVRQKSKTAWRDYSSSAVEDPFAAGDIHAQRTAILDEELAHAKDIAERMDQLITSPPFDKQGNLLELRGMVALWISDLTMGTTTFLQDYEYLDTDASGSYDEVNNASVTEKRRMCTDSLRELRQAAEFFSRAHRNGLRLGLAVSEIEVKTRDLTKLMTKLGE